MTPSRRKWIMIWLFTGCFMVYLMVVIGGITRLTGSGLSITEWNLVMGSVPPMSDEAWNETFAKYQASPQFQKVNYDFGLEEFKSIFWWEYFHRLLGRVIGIVFIIPFAIFVFKKWLNRALIFKYLMVLFLGGFQGLLGWYMVKSGLVDDPKVSHFRLAAHLVTAFITFAYIFYLWLDLYFLEKEKPKEAEPSLVNASGIFFGILILQLVYGGFTAGLHAGRIYTTFPKMGDDWIPEAVYAMDGFIKNISENLAGVQFAHRILAFILFFLGSFITIYIFNRIKDSVARRAALFMVSALGVQFVLGVFTLIYSVPITLGVLHQSGAFFLFVATIFLYHRLRAIAV